ncbi:6,7-dimethyl-8-ribityllumazine synthase [Candidatus Nomurabacteria bacterium]|nr:6,7-dimethyl-8-ribityllumazine synthase [Candidatus Nomurabacteria bacterium]
MQIKSKTYKYLDGSKLKAGIVVARWNNQITDELLKSALVTLKKSKVSEKKQKIISVAGSVEIPFALHKLARSNKYDFLIALGCVIKGDTPHFDYVCKMAQEGVLEVMLEDNIPVGFGVLTVNNLKQAKARIHVGGEATLAALELALIK